MYKSLSVWYNEEMWKLKICTDKMRMDILSQEIRSMCKAYYEAGEITREQYYFLVGDVKYWEILRRKNLGYRVSKENEERLARIVKEKENVHKLLKCDKFCREFFSKHLRELV